MGLCRAANVGVCSPILFCQALQSLVPTCSSGNGLNMFTCLDNINDVKNGLPLWKPIEWAFDPSRLCFTFDKNSDKFIAKIMDPSILTKKLVDIGQEKMGTDWKRPPYPLQNLTFQDIDNRALEFDPGRPLRPYKRVLNFQARQARTYSIQHGWQPASWNFEDNLTEGMDLSEKLKIWYNSMH